MTDYTGCGDGYGDGGGWKGCGKQGVFRLSPASVFVTSASQHTKGSISMGRGTMFKILRLSPDLSAVMTLNVISLWDELSDWLHNGQKAHKKSAASG